MAREKKMDSLSEQLEEKGISVNKYEFYIFFGSNTKSTEIVTKDDYYHKQHYTVWDEFLWIFDIIKKEYFDGDKIIINVIKNSKNLHIPFLTLFKTNYNGKFIANIIEI